MNKHIQIGTRKIGLDYPPLVITEIGINHEGSLNTAMKMVDAAFSAGAEVIKHQTHIVEDEMSSAAKSVIPGNSSDSIYDIMVRCALSYDDEYCLKEYVENKGMLFLSTPFSRAAANRLESMNVTAYKIGSGELNNYPLLEHVADYGKPMIVSTGMNDIVSISKAVGIMERKGVPFALLHTTNIYPTPAHLVRLGALIELQHAFPGVITGLSDHTTSNYACLAATALGACILERHFTDRKNRKGPDIVCSMNTRELSELIYASSLIAQMRGGRKVAAIEENPTIDFAFATVVAITDIKAGSSLSRDNIWVKRPGIGSFSAEEYESLIGKVVSRYIRCDEHIDRNDIL